MMVDVEWEVALEQLDRLTDQALADLAKKITAIQKKRQVTATVFEEAFE